LPEASSWPSSAGMAGSGTYSIFNLIFFSVISVLSVMTFACHPERSEGPMHSANRSKIT
jgi:hypothetical protein